MLYNYLVKVYTVKGRPDFETIGKALDEDAEIVPLIESASVSIERALSKLRLSFEDGIRSKAVTDLLAKELAVSTRGA
jgi:hypothetical protein